MWDDPTPVPPRHEDDPLTVVITGHRPPSFRSEDDSTWAVGKVELMIDYLRGFRPSVLVTGMAVGTDQWTASYALRVGMPVHCVLPFEGQNDRWRQADKDLFTRLLTQAWRVTKVRDVPPANRQQAVSWLHDRNRWMAEYAQTRLPLACAIAVWNGEASGTAHAVGQLRDRKVPLVHINPVTRWVDVDPGFPGYTASGG